MLPFVDDGNPVMCELSLSLLVRMLRITKKVHRLEIQQVSKAWSQAGVEAQTLHAGSSFLAEDAQRAPASTPTISEAAATTTATATGGRGQGHVIANGTPGGKKSKEALPAFFHRRVCELFRAQTGGKAKDPDEAILGYMMRKQCTFEGCDDLAGVSLAEYGAYSELEGGDVRVPGGFSRVVDVLAGKVSVY